MVDKVFLTRNSDSMGPISLFCMFKLGSFEVKSILGVLWSTTGQLVTRGGRWSIFDIKFGFSGSDYPISHVQIAYLRV